MKFFVSLFIIIFSSLYAASSFTTGAHLDAAGRFSSDISSTESASLDLSYLVDVSDFLTLPSKKISLQTGPFFSYQLPRNSSKNSETLKFLTLGIQSILTLPQKTYFLFSIGYGMVNHSGWERYLTRKDDRYMNYNVADYLSANPREYYRIFAENSSDYAQAVSDSGGVYSFLDMLPDSTLTEISSDLLKYSSNPEESWQSWCSNVLNATCPQFFYDGIEGLKVSDKLEFPNITVKSENKFGVSAGIGHRFNTRFSAELLYSVHYAKLDVLYKNRIFYTKDIDYQKFSLALRYWL